MSMEDGSERVGICVSKVAGGSAIGSTGVEGPPAGGTDVFSGLIMGMGMMRAAEADLLHLRIWLQWVWGCLVKLVSLHSHAF